MSDRIAGKMSVKYNGVAFNAVGAFKFNLGAVKRKGLVGPDRVHGHSELPQIPYVKGEIRDSSSLNVTDDVLNMQGATVVLEVANGKQYMFEGAYYSGDGELETEEGKVQFEAEADDAEEVAA